MTVKHAEPHGVIFEFRFDRVNETSTDSSDSGSQNNTTTTSDIHKGAADE